MATTVYEREKGVYVPYSIQTLVQVLLRLTKTRKAKVLWDEIYGFLSSSEKTSKSNRLQMSLQRQHFLLSYFKSLSVGPRPPAQQNRRSPNWANQAANEWIDFEFRDFRKEKETGAERCPAIVHEIVTGGYAGQLFANRPFGLVD